jgi:hypothetical protein
VQSTPPLPNEKWSLFVAPILARDQQAVPELCTRVAMFSDQIVSTENVLHSILDCHGDL